MSDFNLNPAIHIGLAISHEHPIYFYQPIEGGWRCQDSGPYRYDEYGCLLTFLTLDAAAAWIIRVREQQTKDTAAYEAYVAEAYQTEGLTPLYFADWMEQRG